MPTNDDGDLNSPDDDGNRLDDRPERTTDEIVPVSVPRGIEQEAHRRADRLGVALEDALADHVNVVPVFAHSVGRADDPENVRRVALHTTVTPETAAAIDRQAEGVDREEWVRDAVETKLAKVSAPTGDLPGQ